MISSVLPASAKNEPANPVSAPMAAKRIEIPVKKPSILNKCFVQLFEFEPAKRMPKNEGMRGITQGLKKEIIPLVKAVRAPTLGS